MQSPDLRTLPVPRTPSERLRLPDGLAKPLFALLVLAGALLLGYAIADGKLIVLAGVGLLVAVVAGLRVTTARDPYGLALQVLLLAALLLGFFTLPTGRDSRLPISLLVALGMMGMWAFGMVLRHNIVLRPSPLNAPVLAFVAANLIAYFWSLLMRDPGLLIWASFPLVQVAALVVNVSLPLLLLAASNLIQRTETIERLVKIFLVVAAICMVLFYTAPHLHDLFFVRASRGLFGMWVAALALALALFPAHAPGWLRALLLGLFAAVVYRFFVLGQSWISGWLPLAVACSVVLFLYSRRLFVIVALIVLLYVAVNAGYYYTHIVLQEEAGGSGTGRVQLWMTNLQHVRNHPLFGMGPAGYAVYNMTYHADDARSTHNNYFDVLSQTGIVGFALFLWLWSRLLRVGRTNLKRVRHSAGFLEAFSAAALAGCFGALVAMMLGDWVLPFAYNETISGFDHAAITWLFLGCMGALAHLTAPDAMGRKPQ